MPYRGFLAALVASVVVTPAAQAAEPVDPRPVEEVRSESSGSYCGTTKVVSHVGYGRCKVRLVAHDVEMRNETIFGETFALRCDYAFTMVIAGDGHAAVGRDRDAVTPARTHNVGCSSELGGVRDCTEAPAQNLGYDIDGFFRTWAGSDDSVWIDAQLCVENTPLGTLVGNAWLKAVEGRDGHLEAVEAKDAELRNPKTGPADLRTVVSGRWDVVGPSVEVLP